jgi:hypothetical protein
MHHCGEFRMLALHSPQRFVAVCTCGALHLQWDAWGLQLHPNDLGLIQTVLENSHTLHHGQFSVQRGEMASYAISCEHSCYRFWYGKSSVVLDWEAFTTFKAMVLAVQRSTLAARQQFAALGLN